MFNRQDAGTQSNAMVREEYEWVAREIFLSSLEVHKALGPGLLESVYEYSLLKEMRLRNIEVEYQVKVPLYYKGYDTQKEFFIDLLVMKEIVIEVKSVDALNPVHEAQLLSYLKLANKKLGFLINFNVILIKDGFKRRVNNY